MLTDCKIFIFLWKKLQFIQFILISSRNKCKTKFNVNQYVTLAILGGGNPMIRIIRNVTENKKANFILLFYKHMVCLVLILLVTFGKKCNSWGKKASGQSKWSRLQILLSGGKKLGCLRLYQGWAGITKWRHNREI